MYMFGAEPKRILGRMDYKQECRDLKTNIEVLYIRVFSARLSMLLVVGYCSSPQVKLVVMSTYVNNVKLWDFLCFSVFIEHIFADWFIFCY